MPLHLNSITNDSQNSEILAWMLREGMDKCDSIFITEDQKYLHIRCNIEDRLTDDSIGKMVYTLLHGDKAIEVLDLDIVMNSNVPSKVLFNELRDARLVVRNFFSVKHLFCSCKIRLSDTYSTFISECLGLAGSLAPCFGHGRCHLTNGTKRLNPIGT